MPDDGRTNPDTARSKVVLPAPFAPKIATNCPGDTLNEMLAIACMRP